MNQRREMLDEARRQFGGDLPPMPPRLFWLAIGVGLGVAIETFSGDPNMDTWQVVFAIISIGAIFGLFAAFGTYFAWLLVDPVWQWVKEEYTNYYKKREARSWAKYNDDVSREEELRRTKAQDQMYKLRFGSNTGGTDEVLYSSDSYDAVRAEALSRSAYVVIDGVPGYTVDFDPHVTTVTESKSRTLPARQERGAVGYAYRWDLKSSAHSWIGRWGRPRSYTYYLGSMEYSICIGETTTDDAIVLLHEAASQSGVEITDFKPTAPSSDRYIASIVVTSRRQRWPDPPWRYDNSIWLDHYDDIHYVTFYNNSPRSLDVDAASPIGLLVAEVGNDAN